MRIKEGTCVECINKTDVPRNAKAKAREHEAMVTLCEGVIGG